MLINSFQFVGFHVNCRICNQPLPTMNFGEIWRAKSPVAVFGRRGCWSWAWRSCWCQNHGAAQIWLITGIQIGISGPDSNIGQQQSQQRGLEDAPCGHSFPHRFYRRQSFPSPASRAELSVGNIVYLILCILAVNDNPLPEYMSSFPLCHLVWYIYSW